MNDSYPSLEGREPNERRAPPFQPGNDAATKHGARASALKLAPRAAELAAGLREDFPGLGPSDEPLVLLHAGRMVKIERLNLYLDRVGVVDSKGRVDPAVDLAHKIEVSAEGSLEKLRARSAAAQQEQGSTLAAHLAARYGSES